VEFARSVVSRLRQFVGDRRRSPRQAVRLPFTISISGGAKNLNGTKRSSSIGGHTLDLSESGLALIVPSIRLGEHHLVGENRSFIVSLDLPPGPVEMQVAPVRYEALDQEASESGFLIGVKIISMPDMDRAKFGDYVSELLALKG
jgi:hypothetical protein